MSEDGALLRSVSQGKSPIRGERILVHWSFEGGGFVQIMCAGNVSTEEALAMAEKLLNLKRREFVASARGTAEGRHEQTATSAVDAAESTPLKIEDGRP